MSKYTIDREGGLWRIDCDGEPAVWFREKWRAEDWLDAMENRETPWTRAETLCIVGLVLCGVGLGFLFGLWVFGGHHLPSQSTPPSLGPTPAGWHIERYPVALGVQTRRCSVSATAFREAVAAVASRCAVVTAVPLLGQVDRGVGGDTHNLCPLPGKEPRLGGGTAFRLRRLCGGVEHRTFCIPSSVVGRTTAQDPNSKNVTPPGRLPTALIVPNWPNSASTSVNR